MDRYRYNFLITLLCIIRSAVNLNWSTSRSSTTSETDFFDLLARVQASRIDDQRCCLPQGVRRPRPESQQRLEALLTTGGCLPMLSLPGDDTWWRERAGEEDSEGGEGEQEDVSRVYRGHFLHTEHFNFVGVTHHGDSGEEVEELPLVASVKYYSDGHVR